MVRNIAAWFGGLVAGAVVIGLVQGANMSLFPPPAGTDLNDPAQLAALMATIPLGALIGVELSYALGCTFAGYLVGRIASSHHQPLAISVGLLFTLAGAANLMAIPHPVWFAVLTTLTYVPAAFLGVRMAGK
jgi:hypothetical protein